MSHFRPLYRMIVAVGCSWVAAYIYEARMPEPAELVRKGEKVEKGCVDAAP